MFDALDKRDGARAVPNHDLFPSDRRCRGRCGSGHVSKNDAAAQGARLAERHVLISGSPAVLLSTQLGSGDHTNPDIAWPRICV